MGFLSQQRNPTFSRLSLPLVTCPPDFPGLTQNKALQPPHSCTPHDDNLTRFLFCFHEGSMMNLHEE